MPYGFYITDTGRRLLGQAATDESKVVISKACFGSGGDPGTDINPTIQFLNHQTAEKLLNPLTDSYGTDLVDPSQINISVVAPDTLSGIVNEIGFTDDKDNLIIYGVTRDKTIPDDSEVLVEFKNWVKLENGDQERIEINIQSPEFEQVETALNGIRNEMQTLKTTIENEVDEKIGDIDLSSLAPKSDLNALDKKARQLIPNGTQLSNGSDDLNADEYLKLGNYYCPMANTAKSMANCPTDHGFIMEVMLPLNAESYVVRIITDSVGDQWYQGANSKTGSFVCGEWDKIVKESRLAELEARITALETTLRGVDEALERLV